MKLINDIKVTLIDRISPKLPVGFEVTEQTKMDDSGVRQIIKLEIAYRHLDSILVGEGPEDLYRAKEKFIESFEREVMKEVRDKCYDIIMELRQSSLSHYDVNNADMLDELYRIIYGRH